MRKTKVVRAEHGRDLEAGRVFLITEMPAAQAEKFGARAWLAIAHSQVDIPEGFENAGWAGLAFVSLRALNGAPWAEVEPLMDEMMGCVRIIRDERNPELVFPLLQDEIEEVATRLLLRKEIIDLHTGFFTVGAPWTSGAPEPPST